MSSNDPQKIKLYNSSTDLDPALWDDLGLRRPFDAAEAVGAAWDGQRFQIDLLGRSYSVDPAARQVIRLDRPQRPAGFLAGLVLLTTLANSRGVPPSGTMATPEELPGGRMFFAGPHQVPVRPLVKRFGADPAALIPAAAAIGGRAMEGADAAVALPGLPLVPMYVLIWQGDGEFEPRAVIGLDSRAHFHLSLDGVFALLHLLIHRLTKEA